MTPAKAIELDNGLRLVAQRTVGMTGCAVAVNYRAGFRCEPRNRAGFAHLFEHLMFQGSSAAPRGQHFAEIQAAGGTVNGNTFTDIADYHQTAPIAALRRILALEADRMWRLELTQQTLDVQRAVVFEEIHMQLDGRAYGGFPWTVLPDALYNTWQSAHNGFGSTAELRRATIEDCQSFYDSFYAPANAAVGIGADVDPDELLSIARNTFESVPYRRPAEIELPAEPPRLDRRVTEHIDRLAPRPAIALGWQLPDPGTALADYATHALLAGLLTGGGRSRLRRSMHAHDMLVDTSLGLFGPLMAPAPDTFVLVAHHGNGDENLAEKLVRDQLLGVATDTSDADVASALRVVLAQLFQQLDGGAHRTRLMTRGALLFDNPDLERDYLAALRAVSAADVRQAASEFAQLAGTAVVRLRNEPSLAGAVA